MGEIIQSEEVVKLYEYDQYKPELEEVIEHFGILGMRWGSRNGPPYPLSKTLSTGKRLKPAAKRSGGSGESDDSTPKKHKLSRKQKRALKKARKTRAMNQKIKTQEKMKKEQLEKSKEEIIKNKDIKSMLNNVDKFSSQEINDMLNRLNVEQRLKEEVNRQERANRSLGKKIKDGFVESAKEGLASGGRQVTRTVAKNAVKMGTKALAVKLVGEAKTEGGDPYKVLIAKLFKEEKK